MEFVELKKRYEKNPNDPQIWDWILENIKDYVRHKQYPGFLAPGNAGSWEPDGYLNLREGFLKGRIVKDRKTSLDKTISDYNLAYILDTCNNIKCTNELLQEQIHFYFQKTRRIGIRENIWRRVRNIFRKDKRFHVFDETGGNPTYGLNRWRESVSVRGVWQGEFSDLYQIVYANLGDYVPKTYSQHSAYNSPEISDADLTEMLCNLIVAADRRLTRGQIMYVLGYELDIREPEIESLHQETEDQKPLLETIAIDEIAPDQRLIYAETADRIYKDMPEPLRELLPHVHGAKSVKDVLKKIHRPQSTVTEQLGRIKKVLDKHVPNRYDLKPIWDILMEKYYSQS